jgi:pimeloyl-[acyl-carrier protein] methyl ester esterase
LNVKAQMTKPQSAHPSIVLVSGWSFTRAMWQPLIADLEQHGMPSRQVITVDWLELGRWLFCDAPCPIPPVLLSGDVRWMGWSLGGSLLLEAIAQQKILPAQAIIVSASPKFLANHSGHPPWPGISHANWRALRQHVQRDAVGALAQFDRWLNLPSLTCRHRDAADLVLGLDWLAKIDQRAWLDHVFRPITWVDGGQDPLLPHTKAGLTWRACLGAPQAAFGVTLPEAGHNLPWSHRAELIRWLLACEKNR